jgi:hypothetical protein
LDESSTDVLTLLLSSTVCQEQIAGQATSKDAEHVTVTSVCSEQAVQKPPDAFDRPQTVNASTLHCENKSAATAHI